MKKELSQAFKVFLHLNKLNPLKLVTFNINFEARFLHMQVLIIVLTLHRVDPVLNR